MLAVQEVEQTSFKLPPDVSFRKEQSGLTISFVFSHKKLSSLGKNVPLQPGVLNHAWIAPKSSWLLLKLLIAATGKPEKFQSRNANV
jgi:hypothetical protein